jgi:hypothetical protein
MLINASKASALVLLLACQGCDTFPEARAVRTEQRFELAAAMLERRTDADSLAGAGMLRSSERRPDLAVDLLARATAAAPERADLAWLEIQVCRDVPTCDPEPKAVRLRTLDPSNGAAWLNALARANAANDEAARINVLSALARTARVNIYWTTIIVHLTRALADTQKVPLREALVDVIGVLAAKAIPAYSATSNLCKGDRLNNVELVGDCRNVALAFERGDTYITELMGVAIAKRVWPVDSPEWKAAAEARRVYEYRSKLWMHSELSSLRNPRWAERYLALCEQNRREQDVERQEFIDEGKSPDPPPNWAP